RALFSGNHTNITEVRDVLPNWAEFSKPFGFDPSSGNVVYTSAPCNEGKSSCIYRITIRDLSPQYQFLGDHLYANTAGDASTNAWQAGDLYMENMTPPSAGRDLEGQIAANSQWAWTSQGVYGPGSGYTTAKWVFKGFSGKLAFFE